MVGFGQPSFADVSFSNPRHPVAGIHTLRLKDLYRRAPGGATVFVHSAKSAVRFNSSTSSESARR